MFLLVSCQKTSPIAVK